MGATAGPQRRWFRVGTSSAHDAGTADRQATRAALAGDDPRLIVVFASTRYDQPALLRAIEDTSGGVPLIGCTAAGETMASGAADGGVVVAALGGPGFAATTAGTTTAAADLRRAGYAAAAAAAASSTPRAHRVMLMLSDGTVSGQDALIRGASGAVGTTLPLVGGLAGNDGRSEAMHQFCDGEALRDGVVTAMLDSDGPIGVGVRHGRSRVQQATADACSAAMAALNGHPAIGALAFDSVGRRRLLRDDGSRTDVMTIAAETGAPVAACAIHRDIARLSGPNGFHNQTLVMLTLG